MSRHSIADKQRNAPMNEGPAADSHTGPRVEMDVAAVLPFLGGPNQSLHVPAAVNCRGGRTAEPMDCTVQT